MLGQLWFLAEEAWEFLGSMDDTPGEQGDRRRAVAHSPAVGVSRFQDFFRVLGEGDEHAFLGKVSAHLAVRGAVRLGPWIALYASRI